MITPNEYQQAAIRTAPTEYEELASRTHATKLCEVLHAAMGINTEAGELMDILKKSCIYAKAFDRENYIEELGDLLWYIALGAQGCDITLEEVMQLNINKLTCRYPEKFTTFHAQERLDKQ